MTLYIRRMAKVNVSLFHDLSTWAETRVAQSRYGDPRTMRARVLRVGLRGVTASVDAG